jgi:hypothetical protein
MKRIAQLVIAVTILLPGHAFAQWVACSGGSVTCTTQNVGIGTTTTPAVALEVNGNVRSTQSTGSFSVGGAAPAGYQFFATNSAVTTPTGFQLQSNYSSVAATYIGNFGNYGSYFSQNRDPQNGTFVNVAASPNQLYATSILLGDTNRGRLFQITNFPGGVETPRVMVDYTGKVGIGTITPTQMLDVNGSINVAGNINAKYQDIAEWVPASGTIEPGTVVVVDSVRLGEVVPSSTSYDTAAAGVVSAKPGITLGEASASKVQVATSGRVRVKVDATKFAVKVGDLLVTSDKPGMAMKSVPVDVNGIKMHRPGTLIGKALEPLDKGTGEILVLLSMQ